MPANRAARRPRSTERRRDEHAAVDPHSPAELLDDLSRSPNKFVRSKVAANPSLPPVAAALLATDPDDYVRSGLAQNPSTRPDLLAALSADSNVWVRRRVAEHPNTPVAVLADLAAALPCTRRDEDAATVSAAALANTHLPDEAIIDLLRAHPRDRYASQVEALVDGLRKRRRPSRTRTIEVVAFDCHRSTPRLREIPIEEPGRYSPDLMRTILACDLSEMLPVVASQPDAPDDVLAAIVDRCNDLDSHRWTLVRIAENPATSSSLLSSLIEASDIEVNLRVAARDDLSDVHVQALLASTSGRVRLATLSRAPERTEWALNHSSPAVRAAVASCAVDLHTVHLGGFEEDTAEHDRWLSLWSRIESLLEDPDKAVRTKAAATLPLPTLSTAYDQRGAEACKETRAALAERTTNPVVLNELSQDPEKVVRRRVMRNPACSGDLLVRLASDPDRLVREYAGVKLMEALGGI